MPPKQAPASPFAADERVFCFHMDMLYEARILDVMQVKDKDGDTWKFKIHYKGWKNTWDDWVPLDRVRKFNDENKELAAQLREQAKALQQKTNKLPKKLGKPNGSDFSSARGSEERTAAVTTASGRGPRRARDFELENVSSNLPIPSLLPGRAPVIFLAFSARAFYCCRSFYSTACQHEPPPWLSPPLPSPSRAAASTPPPPANLAATTPPPPPTRPPSLLPAQQRFPRGQRRPIADRLSFPPPFFSSWPCSAPCAVRCSAAVSRCRESRSSNLPRLPGALAKAPVAPRAPKADKLCRPVPRPTHP